MKLFICQINTVIGNLAYNKKKILNGYKKGVALGADLVVFPELALVGYPPLDLIEKKEFREAVDKATNEIALQTNSTGLIFGTITADDDNIGTDVFNSAVLCFDGDIKFVQPKSLIPNYDVFDEMRYFDASADVKVYEFKGEKLGISVCEDIWNDADYWHIRRYNFDPVERQIKKGATLLINISASPYSYGKREGRRQMLETLTDGAKVPVAYVCCAGAQTELIFDGASMCFNGNGSLVKLAKSFGEDYFIFDTEDLNESPLVVEKSFEEEVYNALVYGLKDYCSKLGFKKVLVGLSGGIDSALVTTIAVEAMGKKNVHVVLMPSKYSSEGSVKDSEKLTCNLGISSNNISIQPVVDATLEQLKTGFGKKAIGVTEENIQARVRGLFLMAFSNQYGSLLLTTGNKSELAVGYCTLYGDMCGGLAVIADLYKTDVYKISNYINRDVEIIPKEIIDKAPSAELKHDQKDQDTLPKYELLDEILRMYLEQNKEINEITKIIGNEEVVVQTLKMVDRNEFKRRQAAPALRISKKAFGYGRRYPIVQGWR